MESYFNETTCYIFLGCSLFLLLAEAFIPSFGALSILAVLFAGGAVVSGFYTSMVMGFVILGSVVVGFPIIVIILFKNLESLPLAKKLIPPPPETQENKQEQEYLKLIGKPAITLTPLRPSGIVKVGNVRLDVLTEGEHIEKNTTVTILRVEGMRVFVRKKER